nr:hypothetical protein CFP56_47440 [Quercus suber]
MTMKLLLKGDLGSLESTFSPSDHGSQTSKLRRQMSPRWIRFNELPIEYYNFEALLQIWKSIGNVLRGGIHTANEARGRFARLCVQINMDKPLVIVVLIGKFKQPDCYEGEGPSKIMHGSAHEEAHERTYGPWIIVARRRNVKKNQKIGGAHTVLDNGRLRQEQRKIENEAINVEGVVVEIPEVVLDKIPGNPTRVMGWVNNKLRKAWKNIFPLTETSAREGGLDLLDPMWTKARNTWWEFLTNTLLSEEERHLVRETLPQISLMPVLCKVSLMESLSE